MPRIESRRMRRSIFSVIAPAKTPNRNIGAVRRNKINATVKAEPVSFST